MELSEIRTKIDAVDDQLLQLFLERMNLAEEVAAYKNEHHLPILNKQREREVLAKITEKAGDKERYAYHLYSTLYYSLNNNKLSVLLFKVFKREDLV